MAEAAKTVGRKKKGEGPFIVNYLDADGKEVNRIPTGATAIQVADKKGSKKVFKLGEFSPAVLFQLAGESLSRKMKLSINADFNEKSDNVISLAENIFADVKGGKLFQRAESKPGSGRTFDVDMWVSVVQRMAKLLNEADPKLHKLATKPQLEDLKTKLLAASTDARDAWKKKHMKNNVFAYAKKQIDAEKAGSKAKSATPADSASSAFEI